MISEKEQTAKDLYKARRELGQRGQGPLYFGKRGVTNGTQAQVGNKPVTKKARLKHTKRARKEELNG